MIGLEDRQALAQDITAAHAGGGRLQSACEIAGIDVCTLQRWKAQDGLTAGDVRPQAVHPTPGHALSPQERAALLAVANEPRFASVPPARIVPMLADEGPYLGSESSMARVLREHGQNARRGRANNVYHHHFDDRRPALAASRRAGHPIPSSPFQAHSSLESRAGLRAHTSLEETRR